MINFLKHNIIKKICLFQVKNIIGEAFLIFALLGLVCIVKIYFKVRLVDFVGLFVMTFIIGGLAEQNGLNSYI